MIKSRTNTKFSLNFDATTSKSLGVDKTCLGKELLHSQSDLKFEMHSWQAMTENFWQISLNNELYCLELLLNDVTLFWWENRLSKNKIKNE